MGKTIYKANETLVNELLRAMSAHEADASFDFLLATAPKESLPHKKPTLSRDLK